MSPANIPMTADRLDIHKSCKSIENLLNILNEYCEAASAAFVLQKKLAKALRETAGLKITGEVSGMLSLYLIRYRREFLIISILSKPMPFTQVQLSLKRYRTLTLNSQKSWTRSMTASAMK